MVINIEGRKSKLKGKSYEEIYGAEKAEEVKRSKSTKLLNNFIPELKKQLENLNLELVGNYNGATKKSTWRCKKCGYVFERKWSKIKENYKIHKCSNCRKIETNNRNEEKNKSKRFLVNKLRRERRKELRKNKPKLTQQEKQEIIIRRRKTLRKKYGVNHQMELDSIRKKIRNTNLKKYGTEYPQQNKEIREKTRNTNLKKYGVEHTLQDPNIRKKGEETNIEKYGEIHWSKSLYGKEILQKLNIEKNKKSREFLCERVNIEINEQYKHAHFCHSWKCLKCGNNFETLWNYIQQGYRCPTCFPRVSGTSVSENELYNFVKTSLPNKTEIIKNDRNIIKPLEIDIYIPDIKVGIEFNGLYWHSEKIKYSKYYHLQKTQVCIKKGIRLIHIFEDEWLYKRKIIESRLKNIIGIKNNKNIIYGRSCVIREISSKEKNLFLEENHLQGKDNSQIKLGAFYQNTLISVLTFSQGNISKGSYPELGVWELNRFCSKINYHIPGIFGKMLSYFKRNYEWKKIFTYADLRWSIGNLYMKTGFSFISKTNINYWYVKNGKRIHRFSLRKRSEEPKEITERDLRISEGYYIIWDCGNLKFEIYNEKLYD